jgi:hypothetical protein
LWRGGDVCDGEERRVDGREMPEGCLKPAASVGVDEERMSG